MKNKTFNLHTLVSAEAVDRQVCKDITYMPAKTKKSFWGTTTTTPGGFYFSECMYVTTKEITSGKYTRFTDIFPLQNTVLQVDGTVAYYPPYVKLKFTDGDGFCKQDFNTYEEALKYKEDAVNAGISAKLDCATGEITVKE